MSLEGWKPYGHQPYAVQPWGQQSMMRAADADRERAIDVLKAGFAEGRLSRQDFETRLTRVEQADTYGELHTLVADLPQGPTPQPTPQSQFPQPQPHPHWPLHPTPIPPPPGSNNENAFAALICGLLTPFTMGLTSIPAVILGHKARAEIRRNNQQGDGHALTGLVFGYLGIAAWIVSILGLIVLLASV